MGGAAAREAPAHAQEGLARTEGASMHAGASAAAGPWAGALGQGPLGRCACVTRQLSVFEGEVDGGLGGHVGGEAVGGERAGIINREVGVAKGRQLLLARPGQGEGWVQGEVRVAKNGQLLLAQHREPKGDREKGSGKKRGSGRLVY